ncbi:MAG TPA: Asp-tRNA(Asn)/Glu-tRNA(Gln) amidotransferase subunit GatC, partial [Fimbriimonadaceae bacterium]|nr:Asp-tRNA(Asn)/Glu-tRNA(Gln) amidotransferase subunit GatC [Fimbriimonadaceae bacterium]
RLQLDETEMLSLQGELNALLGHMADIQAIDVEGIDPKSHVIALRNVWVDDSPDSSMPRSKALMNSASSKAGLFLVPAIIED